jgi:2-hydroxychromene-2-carboxylate isomerase
MKTVTFYFDIVSSYSYLAQTQLDALTRKTGATIEWKPFLLGGVFKATGNTSPVTLPAKAPYLLLDASRWAKHYGVPFHLPQHFPFNSIKILRAIIAAGEQGSALAKAAFKAVWADGRDLTDDAELRRLATSVGLDADRVLQAIDTPEVKDRLRANTEEAVARGAFGAPSFFVGDELFFGNDRFQFIEAALSK